MKTHSTCLVGFVCISIFFAAVSHAREGAADPLVTSMWLLKNIDNPGLRIVDIRKVEEYKEGHIPGAVSLTYTAWRTREKDRDCQLPFWDDLEDTVCSIGLNENSHVILVGKASTNEDLVNLTRVAWTLKYAGVNDISALDGGYDQWLADRNPVSKVSEKPSRGFLKCRPNNDIIVTKKDIDCSCTSKAIIIDTRPAEEYRGEMACKTVKKKGHIPGAVNLPFSLVFTKEGRFQKKESLQEIAYRQIGRDKNHDIIILCADGRYASAWWFVLSEMLAYNKVRIYDGSMEDWCCDEDAPIVIER